MVGVSVGRGVGVLVFGAVGLGVLVGIRVSVGVEVFGGFGVEVAVGVSLLIASSERLSKQRPEK